MFRISCLILVLTSIVFCLYEDQIGLYDWHQEFIGKVRDRIVDSRVIILTTEKNILAAVDVKSGKLMWRHKFNSDDMILEPPIVSNDEVVTYHNSKQFRYWNVMTGVLVRDVNTGNSRLLHYTTLHDNIMRLTEKGLNWGRTSKSGSAPFTVKDTEVFGGFLHTGGKVEAFIYTPGQTGQIITYASSEKSATMQTIELRWATDDVKFVSSDDSIAALKGDIVYYKVFGMMAFRNVILSEIGITWQVSDIRPVGKSVYIVTGGNKSAVIHIKEGFMKAVRASNKDMLGSVISADSIVLVSLEDKTVSLVQLSNGHELDTYTLPDPAYRGKLLAFSTLSSSHNCSLVGEVKIPGLLLFWEDESITVEGKVAKCGWVREESLSSVVSAHLVDLPASYVIPSNMHKHTNPVKMWTNRLFMQFKDLEVFINQHFGSGFGDVSMDMERDSFNLVKIILVITNVGKVHVLHTTDGRVVWNRYLDNIKPIGAEKDQYHVHVLRSSSHFPLPPLVAIVAASNDYKSTVITVVNPLNGDVEYVSNLDAKLAQVQLTNELNNEFTKILVILTDDDKVHTYPPNSHTLIEHLPIYFTLCYPGTLSLRALQITGNKVKEMWSTSLRGDKISTIATKKPNDEVYSQGRVLGDRSVLHKYINPNIMAVAVETSSADQSKGQIDIQLYDMVSGVQIYHSRHKQYSGPVHMLLTENWLVYHFWNTKLRRYEIVVVEFFVKYPSNSTDFSSLLPGPPPFTYQQAYITSHPITCIDVSSTLRSITNRAILLGNVNGRISSIPKRLLDPRRPVQPTASDKQEQLIPYTPQLMLPPISYINYNNTIQDIKSIVTGTSGLESTSLVFAYGTDLYFTRMTPAKTFDMLNEDFDYYLIGLVLIALCLATIVTHALAEKKALDKKWK